MTQFEMITSTELSGSGMCSISPFRNVDVLEAALALVLLRDGQHLVGHVEAERLARRPDAARREQHVDAAAGAEVEHGFAGLQLGERGRVAAAERGLQGEVRDFALLAGVVEVRRDRIAARLEGRRPAATRAPGAGLARAAPPDRTFP